MNIFHHPRKIIKVNLHHKLPKITGKFSEIVLCL